jgi:hypothetical protein
LRSGRMLQCRGFREGLRILKMNFRALFDEQFEESRHHYQDALVPSDEGAGALRAFVDLTQEIVSQKRAKAS